MKKAVLVYGLAGGLLIAALRLVEYRFLVVEHSIEIYGAIIAALFAGVGIWLGLTLTKTKEVVVVKEVPVRVDGPFVLNAAKVEELGITPRELEILEHIARGSSTREIAAALFVSENTVKTHSTRLFDKLSVNRRTKAAQVGNDAGDRAVHAYHRVRPWPGRRLYRDRAVLSVRVLRHPVVPRGERRDRHLRPWYDKPLLNAAITFTEPFPIGLAVTLISAGVLRRSQKLEARS